MDTYNSLLGAYRDHLIRRDPSVIDANIIWQFIGHANPKYFILDDNFSDGNPHQDDGSSY